MSAVSSNPAKPVKRTIRVNGIALAYHEWRAKPGNNEPPIVIAHATGFHGRCYSAIAEQFPERRVIALDLRGHGSSEGEPIAHWRTMIDDVTAFLDQLRIRRALGVGHSMGAHVLLQAASERLEAFDRLVLFDPVILSPEYYADEEERFTSDAPHPAIRRKRDFASLEAMMERFAAREPYSLFTPRVFEDYCRYGLKERTGGDFVLACAPEMEASVYASSRTNNAILETARDLKLPVWVVRAKQTDLHDFKGSPTWPALASIMPQGTDIDRADRTHFHPFEDPEDAARIIAEASAA
ncbi:MAG: alpha/beta hydrolase [Pseudomonadota bacterium]